MVEHDAQGALAQKETYKYNEKNQKVEQQGYNFNGSLAYTFKYFYNPKGELIETRTFNPQGDLTSKLTQHFKTDAYKNWIERIQYTDGKGSYITETYHRISQATGVIKTVIVVYFYTRDYPIGVVFLF